MNRLAKRAFFAYFLSAAMLIGVLVIAIRYFTAASRWVPFHNNGKIVDRSGVMLMDYSNGQDELADDPVVRTGMLQILGDLEGNISRVVINAYSGDMMGFDIVNGIHHGMDSFGSMEMTLSAQAQKAAVRALGDYHGTIGVYNYETGEILCMVSSPNFDPRRVPDVAADEEKYDGVYTHRFVNSTYAPGSTFKLVTAAAALEEIEDIESRTFTCTGSKQIGSETVICNGVHGEIGFEEALYESCNVAFADIATELGADTLTKYVERFGITESLEFDGYCTRAGHFDVEDATTFETAWAGIGQYTDQINPCQYMYFMGTIANGGKAAQPYLVRNVRYGDRLQYEAKTKMGSQVMERSSSETLAKMMHTAVMNQYGSWYFNGLYAGAKSGTAQRGEGEAANAVFSGFVQDSNYPLAFVVVVEGGGAGGQTCAPMIQQVLLACMADMD